MTVYDVLIIGAAPAGLSAAVYCSRKRLKTLLLSIDVGGQTAWSNSVENYLGFNSIPGVDLVEKFHEHALAYGDTLDFKDGKKYAVTSLEKKGNLFHAVTAGAGTFQAKTVIVASGKNPRKLQVPGEETYAGKGLTYCATCEGPLFANKDVAVIGGGNSAMDAALQLERIARKIYVLNIMPTLQGDPIFQEKVLASPKITVLAKARVERVNGDKWVTGLDYVQDGKKGAISVMGIFVEIGSTPSVDFLKSVKMNAFNEIEINLTCETSGPGLFAAGDVTNGPEKQVVVAAGEGAKAAIRAFEYLTHQTGNY